MSNKEAAERACKEPNPIIDGRKANVNLAILGAKPRGNLTGNDIQTQIKIQKQIQIQIQRNIVWVLQFWKWSCKWEQKDVSKQDRWAFAFHYWNDPTPKENRAICQCPKGKNNNIYIKRAEYWFRTFDYRQCPLLCEFITHKGYFGIAKVFWVFIWVWTILSLFLAYSA